MNAISANDPGLPEDGPCLRNYEPRNVMLYVPAENLHVAIGLIQTLILASDSIINADVKFGKNGFNSTAALEAALSLLSPLTNIMGDVEWGGEA